MNENETRRIARQEVAAALRMLRPWCNTDREVTHRDLHESLDGALAALEAQPGPRKEYPHYCNACNGPCKDVPGPRFEDRGETVYDLQTGLEWERATRDVPSWHDGLDSCAALRVAGHDDWRLPTIKELLSIVDYERCDPTCDPVFDARSRTHWSSSTYQGTPSAAWVVGFADGGTGADFKTFGNYVRAVRAGSLRRAAR